ncbi:MAG: signal peptidase II [bacterium]|nr:signal peptidase II [bacterium]
MTPGFRPGPEPAGLVALALLAADRLTKLIVSQGEEVLTAGPVTVAALVNRSGVLGLPLGNTLLVAAGTVIIVGIAALLLRVRRPSVRVGLWLLLAGALGNTVDRLLYGGVLDIIAIGPSSHFNLADVLILLGGLALFISVWRKDGGD